MTTFRRSPPGNQRPKKPRRFAFGGVAASLTVVVVLLAIAPDVAWADEGHWRLHAIYPERPAKLVFPRTGVLLGCKISSRPKVGGIITRQDFFNRAKPDVMVDEFVISWEWSAIPVILRPGQKIPLTLKGTVATHPTWKHGHVGHSYPFIKAVLRMRNGKEWNTIAKFEGTRPAIVQFSSSDSKRKADRVQTSSKAPAGKPGAELAVVVVIEHPNQENWDWRYVYTWDTHAAPAKVPDPIPAGQKTLKGGGTTTGGNTGPGTGTGTTTGGNTGTGTGTGTGTKTGGNTSGDPNKGRPASMTLQADRRTVKVGGTVTVPVRMLNGKNVGNLDFKVTFDPAVVRPEGKAIAGNLLTGAGFQSNPADRGRMWIAFATTGRISGDGTVAEIPFRAVGRPGQKTVLGIEVTIFNESRDSSAITKVPGEIEILTASGRLRGDLNNNRVIDAADALEALKMAVRLIPMNLDADMDDDETVTSADARILLRKAKER